MGTLFYQGYMRRQERSWDIQDRMRQHEQVVEKIGRVEVLTKEAAVVAEKAYNEANHTNNKLAVLTGRRVELLESAATGPAGEKGDKGDKGDTGAAGAAGAAGAPPVVVVAETVRLTKKQ
jgi:hypothetical protein